MRPNLLLLALGALLNGCVQPLGEPVANFQGSLNIGERRTVELWMMEMNVSSYEQTIDLETLRGLPQSTLDDIWLLDLPLFGLIENSLVQLADLPVDEALQLPVAAQNMRTLLRMTPDNAILDGTSLEELLGLAAVLGIPAARPLAELLEVEVTERVLPIDAAANALVDGLIGSHPASQWRIGPVDAQHPDGQWPVAAGSMPITVGDVVTNFEALPDRFAPAETEWGTHPGFISAASGFSVIDDQFAMTVLVNINAIPYRGVDLTDASGATVNSTGSQIDSLFATERDDWLTIDGMVEAPFISEMTVTIVENDGFVSIGDSRDPLPTGNSAVWDLPPWEIEHLIADMAFEAASQVSAHDVLYELATGTDAFIATIDESAWMSFETFNDVGSPPPEQYLWDLELELAQVRMHDGGLAEGDADIEFTLHDVAVGVQASELVGKIGTNLAANPAALRELASAITENSLGEADFYYFRPAPDVADAQDWLYFLHPDDLPLGLNGGSARPYSYVNPGFFADQGLTQKVSDVFEADGDSVHDKVQIAPGDVLYMGDDQGAVFELEVLGKPSLHRIELAVTRRT